MQQNRRDSEVDCLKSRVIYVYPFMSVCVNVYTNEQYYTSNRCLQMLFKAG